MPEQGKKSELVQLGQLKKYFSGGDERKKQGEVYSLKTQAKDNLINDWEIWFDDIARNVFGLPNTDFTSRLVRGKPLRPRKSMNEIRKGGSIIGNRTRPFAYIFRANEKEKNLIDKAIATSGLTMTEFVIRSITDKPITVIANGNEILAELKRQGNNLNQVVRNSYNGLATEEEIRSCIAELKDLYRKISAAIGDG